MPTALHRSLDEYEIIAAMLTNVSKTHGALFNSRSLRLTLSVLKRRLEREGLGFLTKTLPKLGKALDRALSCNSVLDASELRFNAQPRSKLPRFLGEFFQTVLQPNGEVLPNPCATSVGVLRDILYCFYKYEVPYSTDQEREVIASFERTEQDLELSDQVLRKIAGALGVEQCGLADRQVSEDSPPGGNPGGGDCCTCAEAKTGAPTACKRLLGTSFVSPPCARLAVLRASYCPLRPGRKASQGQTLADADGERYALYHAYQVAQRARDLLSDLFRGFEPQDICPRHGPGVVSTRERLWNKYHWTNVSRRITECYPLDEFFFTSLGHVCDRYDGFRAITDEPRNAKVILVPKDSRGPRLISCEPVDNQWVQQGLSIAIRQLVERHPSTRWNVHFTDQQPNQFGALLGSRTGRYATLDLKEASDRVSVDLVNLLFPPNIVRYLMACRSSATELPDGRVLKLRKYAPMGSSLCFPILALTIWAILTAGADNLDTRESILVYGDDVIVPTAYAEDAIELLESFGLKINRDKSCIKGFFRESCGVDAFQGTNVTPVRFRTVWSSSPSADVYVSWLAYANHLLRKKYTMAYELIAKKLDAIYGPTPTLDMAGLSCPSLHGIPVSNKEIRTRWNPDYQVQEFRALTVSSPVISFQNDGWESLLRYFTESANSRNHQTSSVDGLSYRHANGLDDKWLISGFPDFEPFRVSSYTRRGTNVLKWRWCRKWHSPPTDIVIKHHSGL